MSVLRHQLVYTKKMHNGPAIQKVVIANKRCPMTSFIVHKSDTQTEADFGISLLDLSGSIKVVQDADVELIVLLTGRNRIPSPYK